MGEWVGTGTTALKTYSETGIGVSAGVAQADNESFHCVITIKEGTWTFIVSYIYVLSYADAV